MNTEIWSVSYVIWVDMIEQVSLTRLSISLFLEMLNLKFRFIIIILLTDRPDIILPTARTAKN